MHRLTGRLSSLRGQCLPRRPINTSSCKTIRWQSTIAHDGPPVTETNRTEATMKRFWNEAAVGRQEESYTVLLDNRALKTPAGNTLLVPPHKSLIATLVAAEWENQETLLKHHALPMTALASRAIDAMVSETTRAEVRQALLEYLDTDTICFHQDYPPQLVELQTQHWDPLLSWARTTFDVELHTFDSILFNSQPDETKSKLDHVLSTFDHWEMAAMERATYTTKSFIIALALVRKHLSVEQASLAALVEVASQIQRWGEVEDTHDVDFHDVRRQLGNILCWNTNRMLGNCRPMLASSHSAHHSMLMHNPPSAPDTVHTPFYCEENVYLLCEAFVSQQEEVSAVFISNEQKTVALWNQKLCESHVVWDYHVVLLLRSRERQQWIYDFDSRLPFPCLMKDYLRHTFKENVPEPYRSLFRIVPGSTFVEHFASDRSHMLIEASDYDPQNAVPKRYRSPPPPHAPIRGRSATTTGNNLMESFVDMVSSERSFGKVLDLQGVVRLAEEC